MHHLWKSFVFELLFPSHIVSAHLNVVMTSWQMERVIYKNYKILFRNLIVGINWYKLLILRKTMFSIKIRRYEIQNMRFFFLSVYINVVQIAKRHTSPVLAFNMQTRPNILPDLVFACWKQAQDLCVSLLFVKYTFIPICNTKTVHLQDRLRSTSSFWYI